MRRVVGYDNGRPIWSENQPAEPLAPKWVHGSLVIGARGANDSTKHRDNQRKHNAELHEAAR